MVQADGSKNRNDHARYSESVKVSVDEEPVELSMWDIRGMDYDPAWLSGAQVALVCFSVNIGSTDAKGKHLGRVSRDPKSYPARNPHLRKPS